MDTWQLKKMVKLVLVNIILLSTAICFYSCGDLFEKQRRITGSYYLGENEMSGGLSIYFKTSNGDYIGRGAGKVLEYGFTDNFIVSKNERGAGIVFYLINRKKDADYADVSDFQIGPLTEQAYDSLKKSMNLDIVLKNTK